MSLCVACGSMQVPKGSFAKHVMRCAKRIGRSSHQIETPQHDESQPRHESNHHYNHQKYVEPAQTQQNNYQYEEEEDPVQQHYRAPSPARSATEGDVQYARGNAVQMSESEDYDEATERVACELCNRKFAANRLEKHMDACRKANNRSRKVFDMSAVRTEGTEAAKFYQAAMEKEQATKLHDETPIKRTSLRQSRDSGAIKAMKTAGRQAGGARGPLALAVEMELSECESCGRKFSSDALERHANVCRESSRRQANKKLDLTKTDALLKRTQFRPPLQSHKQAALQQQGGTATVV